MARLRRPLLVLGMCGLGDCIMQRPFVRELCEQTAPVVLRTPWPQLYRDLPLSFVRSGTSLRMQARNEAGVEVRWVREPKTMHKVRFRYGDRELREHGIYGTFERTVGLSGPLVLDLPELGEAPRAVLEAAAGRPIAVVRPVTERVEWLNSSRSPDPRYVEEVARRLMGTHHVVSIASIQDGSEVLLGSGVEAHQRFEHGELGVCEMLELCRAADLLVGGVGWIVPAAIALGTKLLCVQGGCGAHNAREVIVDRRLERPDLVFMRPDRYCLCGHMQHACDKRISDQEFERAWTSVLSATS